MGENKHRHKNKVVNIGKRQGLVGGKKNMKAAEMKVGSGVGKEVDEGEGGVQIELNEILKVLKVEIEKWHVQMMAVNSFRHRFVGGLFNGLGTVLGATLLVAFVLFILTQLASIELIRPVVEEITKIVQSSKR